MRRSLASLVSALLALVITTSLAVATPPEGSPWESTGFRCQTQNGLAGTTYLNTKSGTELCFAS